MAEREGLLVAALLVLRFAPDRCSCAATSKIAPAILSNPLFHVSGSNPRFVALVANLSRPTRIYPTHGGEGGIARRCAPRPPLRSGPLQLRCNVQNRSCDFVEPPFPRLGFESPLRCPRGQLIQTDENLPNAWRRGRDCSSLRSSSSASLRTVAAALQRPKSLLRFCRTPFSTSRVRIPA